MTVAIELLMLIIHHLITIVLIIRLIAKIKTIRRYLTVVVILSLLVLKETTEVRKK